MENMKLNNNLECPMLGLGTFMLSPEDAYTSTLEALKMGYEWKCIHTIAQVIAP